MMPERFLIDSNVFIAAKYFHYNFSYCKMFWDCLVQFNRKGIVYSVNSVKKELLAKPDEISKWVNEEIPPTFFQDEITSMQSYGVLMNWAQTLDVSDKAKEDFASQSKADAFLIAHAMTHGFSIISHEKNQEGAKKRIMIPNAALAHGVNCLSIYEFLALYSGQNFSCTP
ncbi:DUF4411 family protein [Klebsiella pneumoniae]|uniref:DUF4411 family protein n=1 Tax=Klebsiella pneumoniae TaxID=573 RepID=UPI00223DFD08|nr:DUF4411 family protein [Klebsiella pneumoniae]MCX2983515.1 DUF4411 family protein [Klebsiella pneumoniae]HCQ9143822.1 DUF4411 family protein [Klebsiella pneumoniae]HCQ9173641.1 DUF4411 family protein [Klebsiella pneumoniae]HCQ9183012.1 DUF4411 family protein [Klebsiella pneumoniae]HCQ9409695.1 DUF4411 family protein [Klebsiella pneumoniae]